MERSREIIAYLCGFCSINNKMEARAGHGTGVGFDRRETGEFVLMYCVTPLLWRADEKLRGSV